MSEEPGVFVPFNRKGRVATYQIARPEPQAFTVMPGPKADVEDRDGVPIATLPPLPFGGYVVDSVRLLKPGVAYRWDLSPDGRATLQEVQPETAISPLRDSFLLGPVGFAFALVRRLLAWWRR